MIGEREERWDKGIGERRGERMKERTSVRRKERIAGYNMHQYNSWCKSAPLQKSPLY